VGDENDGARVLLLHGGPGTSFNYLDGLAEEIGNDFRVAGYQQRGIAVRRPKLSKYINERAALEFVARVGRPVGALSKEVDAVADPGAFRQRFGIGPGDIPLQLAAHPDREEESRPL
jgi:pimeloyl-ACP methyl ester carboxylesterase